MTARTLMTAVTLYRRDTLSLEQAADYTGISTAKMVSTLHSHGVSVPETDDHSISHAAD